MEECCKQKYIQHFYYHPHYENIWWHIVLVEQRRTTPSLTFSVSPITPNALLYFLFVGWCQRAKWPLNIIKFVSLFWPTMLQLIIKTNHCFGPHFTMPPWYFVLSLPSPLSTYSCGRLQAMSLSALLCTCLDIVVTSVDAVAAFAPLWCKWPFLFIDCCKNIHHHCHHHHIPPPPSFALSSALSWHCFHHPASIAVHWSPYRSDFNGTFTLLITFHYHICPSWHHLWWFGANAFQHIVIVAAVPSPELLLSQPQSS